MISCNFCDKTTHEVKALIAGRNDVHICDECVLLCLEIIVYHPDEPPWMKKPSAPRVEQKEPGKTGKAPK